MPRLDIDALKERFETGDRPDGEDYINLIDTLIEQSTDLGTAGNNEHEITGIENPTIVDSFSATDWRMVKYMISIAKTFGGENKFYSTEMSILIDNDDLNISEYAVIDNDGDIGTISVSRTGNTVNLIITPNPAVKPVTVRFARIGLKA